MYHDSNGLVLLDLKSIHCAEFNGVLHSLVRSLVVVLPCWRARSGLPLRREARSLATVLCLPLQFGAAVAIPDASPDAHTEGRADQRRLCFLPLSLSLLSFPLQSGTAGLAALPATSTQGQQPESHCRQSTAQRREEHTHSSTHQWPHRRRFISVPIGRGLVRRGRRRGCVESACRLSCPAHASPLWPDRGDAGMGAMR
jgi:hypothetical protein